MENKAEQVWTCINMSAHVCTCLNKSGMSRLEVAEQFHF